MNLEVPITDHPPLPEGVPLVADFNDDRNRLSYYFPILEQLETVITPKTRFLKVEGNYNSYPKIEYRDITQFMQGLDSENAFVRGDFSSGKFNGDDGSKIESQDPYDIEQVVLELIRQLSLSKRYLGKRIAVREWIPHETEVRYFIKNGEILYRGTGEDTDIDEKEYPDDAAEKVAKAFPHFSWSVDFIQHSSEEEWYCTDMGLNGLYYSDSSNEWISISEHINPSYSPERYAEEMPVGRFD